VSNTIKFYTDSHIAEAVTTQCQRQGVDIIRCQDVGHDDLKDIDHLIYATEQGRTIITGDADFLRLNDQWLREGRQHAGVIYVQPDNKDNIGLIVRYIVELHDLISGGAGTVEGDISSHLFRI